MMKVLRILFGLFVLIVLAAIAVPFLISPDVISQQLVRVTKEQTGRDLAIGGDTSFSIYPSLGLTLDDVSLSNPPDMPDGIVLAAGRIRVSLALMPLFQGNVKVEAFELTEPRFNLLTDSEGRSNWEVQGGSERSGREDRQPATEQTGTTVKSISLDDISIIDGVVRVLDETTGSALELSDVDVTLALPSLDDRVTIDGTLVWNGETVAVTTSLGPVNELSESKTAGIDLELSSPHLTATFNGRMSVVDQPTLNGRVDYRSPSLRQLARWAGNPLEPGNGLGAFGAQAQIDFTPEEISLNDAQVTVDGMRAQGNVVINTAGERPRITASLGVDRVDLNQYLGAGGGGSNGGGGSSDWSDAPIDLTALRALDADLRLSATQILYRNVTIGASTATVTLDNGNLDARLEQMAFYDGRATGFVQVSQADVPRIAAGLDAAGVSGLPLLRDFADFEWIEGTAAIGLRVTTAGRSQRQFVSALDGTMQFEFVDGAIRGINIAAMMRDLSSQILNGWSRSPAQKTDFAALSASFQIADGIATNNDLTMLGPLVRLTGAGTVSMPPQTLDYRVEPKVVATLEGQGGETGLQGFNVPIIIKGSWSNPQIYPDIAGILQNPQAAFEQLQTIGGNIDADNLRETVGEAIGADAEELQQLEQDAGQAVEDIAGEDGREVLDNFLQGFGGSGD